MTINQKIMLIEDNKDDCEAITRGFQSCNCIHPLQWYKDSTEALEYLTNEDTALPAMIILDLNLPGTDGRSLLKLIKSNRKLASIPVIIVTTSADQKDIEYCYLHGANSYIQKPVNFSKMKEICRSINDYWFNVCLIAERNQPANLMSN